MSMQDCTFIYKKSIYKYIIMHYYYILSELSLEVFHNSLRSCQKRRYSLAFGILGQM